MSVLPSGLVPVHIGQDDPSSFEEEPENRRSTGAQPARIPPTLNWDKNGLEPRWLGTETSDCAIALEPGFFSNTGADEKDRFLAGARQRGELALLISMIGNLGDPRPRDPRSRYDASVNLTLDTSVLGRKLPTGTRPEVAPGLGAADRDLANRLLTRPGESPWWSLHLSGRNFSFDDSSRSFEQKTEGQLQPLLIDALGDPVVASWVSPSGDQRWYLIPAATDWNGILSWLADKALLEYVPGALRRARSPHFAQADLQTTEEIAIRDSLKKLDDHYAAEKQRLEGELETVKHKTDPIRSGLLYSTGDELVQAIVEVMTAAGLHTRDLDQELGASKSADLLVGSGHDPWRLVEVKSAGGSAGERLVADLQRHLDTWPHLRPDVPISGGVLIVNHQHRQHPSERTPRVYSRPEFIAALPVTVLSSLELFHWWRAGDWAAIRSAVLGETTTEQVPANSTAVQPNRRRFWQRS